jgi:tRNA nucleotidyltransferase (CCA-adding enzyme)
VHRRTSDVLRRLKFSNQEITAAAALVGVAAALAVPHWTEPAVRRLLSDASRDHAPLAAAMWRGKGALELADTADAILARGDALATNELAVTGGDLMKELGMAPGRALGDTLKRLLERVLDDPTLNTRDRLFELAREPAAD